ncbi:hypothetical protein HPP92_026251, partial [Vanilla planifolia]
HNKLVTKLQGMGAHYKGNLDQNDQMFKPGCKDILRMNQDEPTLLHTKSYDK